MSPYSLIPTMKDQTDLRPSGGRSSTWAGENIPEGFTVFKFPDEHRRKIRTSNMIERLDKKINRRTRVMGIFPNFASLRQAQGTAYLRLVSEVLMEILKEWEQGRVHLTVQPRKKLFLGNPVSPFGEQEWVINGDKTEVA